MGSTESPGNANDNPIAALLAAADQALAQENVALARTHASEVLRLTEARPDGLDHARARLRLARCDVAVARIERALSAALQAAAAFRQHEQRGEEIAALAIAARAATRAGRLVEAVEAGMLAVALSESLAPGQAAALAHRALGSAHAAGHQFASAERALRTGIELAQRIGDRALLADALIEYALAVLIRYAVARAADDSDAALHALEDALERCRDFEALPDTLGPTRARSFGSAIAIAACLTGDVDDAQRRLARHPEPLRAGIAPHWSAALDAWTRLELAWHTHDPQGAVVHAAQIAAVADAAQHAPLRSLGHLLAADLHESRGDVASALVEWKAAQRHERATRARDLESRGSATAALLAARQRHTLAAEAERFQQLACDDALTGIANLRRFEQALLDALVASTDSGEPLCVALVDCDRFRSVNDAFGHELGDAALRAVAALLQRGVREGDLVARLGGDEFAILFPRTGLDIAQEVCERIAAAVRDHDWHALQPALHMGVSIGVELALPGDTPRSLAARADKAMFEKKLQRESSAAVATRPAAAATDALLARVAHWLANAHQVAVFAGAGRFAPDDGAASAELRSGALPAADDAAARTAFDAAWATGRARVAGAGPGDAQHALAGLARALAAQAIETTFVTERIDGLLARAGASGVIELNGNALRDRCAACGAPSVGARDSGCPTCGLPPPAFRPDVVLAGEAPDARVAAGAEFAAKSADVVLVVDADASLFPGAALIGKARLRGARIVLLGAATRAARALADLALDGPVEALLEALGPRVEAARSAASRDPGDEAIAALR